ncbi:hypothetical protein [Haloferax mucosum]|uniref:hypothetical protein n=1 Tax=Haloferax mucosum TaxID=403181 RepID=UPI000677623E|nr:hypothetical protein [Haloferax mucosum]
MSLDISKSITGGISRAATRNGAILIAAYAIVGLGWQVAFNSLLNQLVSGLNTSGAAVSSSTTILSVDLPMSVLAVLAFVFLILLQYLALVATRVFVGGYERSIPNDVLTRNIPLAIVNLFVGGIVYTALFVIGSFVFLIPGVIAYLAFVFMTFYIAVEDENFIAALSDSWSLTRGNWIRLLLLFVILFVIAFALGIVLVIMSFALSFLSQMASALFSALVFIPLSVLSLGVLAEAFIQLRNEDSPVASSEAI